MELIEIANLFNLDGEAISVSPIGNGHINSTFQVVTSNHKRYILQRINNNAFNNIDVLMNNVFIVTEYLKNNGFESLHPIITKDKKKYVEDNSQFYRVYDYIEDTICYEKVDNMFLVYSNAKAFGRLHKVLKKFDANKLGETIPDFHNTVLRYSKFLGFVREDKYHRAATCLEEIDFIQSRAADYSVIISGVQTGDISYAVTHNDPKINNILFDKFTGDVKAIIDLDTVMPGSYLYDVGDSIRSLLTGDNEDNPDTSKLKVDFDIYEAYLKGYLSEMSEALTPKEVELLPFSVYLLAMELGMRFLSDYLNGDQYFKVQFPEHNLIRARTQLALAKDILVNYEQMSNMVSNMVKKIKEMVVVGIDIGGTSIKGGVVNQRGKLFETFNLPVDKTLNPEEHVKKIIEAVNEFLRSNNYKKEDIFGVGVGVPGLIDSTNGIVTFSGNLKWSNLPLKEMLEEGLGLPVKITNDANAAALAEAKFGSGYKYRSFIMLTLGTGIGSGIFVDGKLYEGNLGKGAEFGHSLLVMDGRLCSCGRRGCLEAYASATALVKDTKEMMEKHKDSLLWKVSEKYEGVNAKVPFEAAKMGDIYAQELVDNYVKYLSEGLLNYFNTFRPEAVILSGGIAEEGKYLIKKIQKYCQEHDYGIKLCPPVDIIKSSVGYDSGKIGAAALFMN